MAFADMSEHLGKVQKLALLDALTQPYGMEDPDADLISVRINSDFMSPYLRPGDFVIVDPNQKGFIDAMYVFERDGWEPKVAYCQYAFGRGFRIFGENKAYDDEYITRDAADALVVGRVVGICKHV